jgi:hypothetical protein
VGARMLRSKLTRCAVHCIVFGSCWYPTNRLPTVACRHVLVTCWPRLHARQKRNKNPNLIPILVQSSSFIIDRMRKLPHSLDKHRLPASH